MKGKVIYCCKSSFILFNGQQIEKGEGIRTMMRKRKKKRMRKRKRKQTRMRKRMKKIILRKE